MTGMVRIATPMLLIAEREFRAYASTLSFWLALAIGPLLLAGAVGMAGLASHRAAPTPIVLAAPSADARAMAEDALRQAAALDHREIAVLAGGAPPTVARIQVAPGTDGLLHARFNGPEALSPAAQALASRTVELTSARTRLGLATSPAPAPAPPSPKSSADQAGAAGRFAVVMMLWLTLTGSLGMLLQAVVRERANRALESLLAAASAADIALGKLLGVGAVSVLVLGAWLSAAAALSPLAPGGGGMMAGLIQGMTQPSTLLTAALIYPLAFAFYGLLTIAVGARARDTAAAQNLSRPMFSLLLVAFFVAMAAAGGAHGLGWLSFAPPFTPFLLLLQAPGALSPLAQAGAFGMLSLAAIVAGWAAITGISVSPAPRLFASLRRAAA